MGNQVVAIEEFNTYRSSHVIIDVRSPGEYEKGHIPGAVSMPLFSNEERAIIGTIYKQQGRRQAMLEALNYYGVNVRHIVEQVIDALKNNTILNQNTILVYCWRGGMRSGVVCWMLNLFGINTIQLKGGYKSFRGYALKQFKSEYNFIILGGKTGSAKTELLRALQSNQFQTIDLENLAMHKGSAFGGLGQPNKVSQEHFENLLADALHQYNNEKPIWLEDESQRIGNINIPNPIWAQMRTAEVYYLDITMKERLKKIVNDYGQFNLEQLADSTIRLRKRLGGLQTQNCLKFLEEGNIENAFEILLNYYDRTYQKSTDKRDSGKVFIISTPTVDEHHNLKLIQEYFHARRNKTNTV